MSVLSKGHEEVQKSGHAKIHQRRWVWHRAWLIPLVSYVIKNSTKAKVLLAFKQSEVFQDEPSFEL